MRENSKDPEAKKKLVEFMLFSMLRKSQLKGSSRLFSILIQSDIQCYKRGSLPFLISQSLDQSHPSYGSHYPSTADLTYLYNKPILHEKMANSHVPLEWVISSMIDIP